MDNLIGTTIEHYQILARIRETPTRILYRAYDPRAFHPVALEVVKVTVKDPARLLEAIRLQAQKNIALEHANIASMVHSGVSSDVVYMVYNFVPTYTLRRFYDRIYSWHDVAFEFVSIAHALTCAHENGVFYGCLNPASVVLDEKRIPILFDFRLEQIISQHLLAHSPGVWINRWGYEYRAPEQFSGALADSRADIYSIGMMIREWMTGSTGFNDQRVLASIQAKRAATESKPVKPVAPPIIQSFIEKCTATDPNRRYQSMKELFILLAHGTFDLPITKRVLNRPLAARAQRLIANRSFQTVTLFVVVLLLSSGLVMSWRLVMNRYISPPVPTFPPTSVTSSTESTSPPQPITLFQETPESTAAPTELPSLGFGPVFQGTSIGPLIAAEIENTNINRLSTISRWGIGNLNELAISSDGNWIAAASSTGVFIFDARNLRLEKNIETHSSMSTVAFSPDSKYLAAGYRDGLIQLWSTDTWEAFEVPYHGHTQAILDLDFSPDSKKLLSVGDDEQVIQWTIDLQQIPKTISTNISRVTSATFSSDGSRIVIGGGDFLLRVLDVTSLQVIATKDFAVQVIDIAAMPRKMEFVVGGSDGKVKILKLENGPVLEVLGKVQHPLTSVAVSPNGGRIAVGDLHGGITVWSTDGTLIWQQERFLHQDLDALEGPGAAHSIVFRKDGDVIFSALRAGFIRSVDAATGAQINESQELNGPSSALKISHNSRYALTQHQRGRVTIWNIIDGTHLHQLDGTIAAGDPFSADDRYLAIASSSAVVKVYELANWQEVYTLNVSAPIKIIQFLPEHNQLAVGNETSMHIWSMSSGQELISQRDSSGHGCAKISDLASQTVFFTTNYLHIVTDTQNSDVLCKFAKLNWVFDINESRGLLAYGGSSKLTVEHTQDETGSKEMSGVNGKQVTTLAISPDGNWLAASLSDTGVEEFSIHIWSNATGEEVLNLYGHDGEVTDIRFSPDGRLLISTSQDGTIRIWGIRR